MASATEIYSAVASHYSAASANRTANGKYESAVAEAFGYTAEELASIPDDANLGLSCGNPHALAALRHGETVVDLGSGAGFDVFLAAPKVGPTGLVIGIDMNKDMLAQAERNRKKLDTDNVRFLEARLTQITPLEDRSVDCVISNCVVNLVPEAEKPLVFKEIFRLLKPGGRVALSDILIRDGCIAGASFVRGYQNYLQEAGFRDILIVDNHKDLNVYSSDMSSAGTQKSCCGTTIPAQDTFELDQSPVALPPAKSCCGTSAPNPSNKLAGQTSCEGPTRQGPENGTAMASTNLKKIDFNEYAGSYNIYAVKPSYAHR